MKFKSLALALTLSVGSVSAYAQFTEQVITGFGTGDFTEEFTDGFTNTQTATSFAISGTDFGSTLIGGIAPAAIAPGTLTLHLTATLSSVTASNFQFTAYDADGDGRIYQGNWSAFTLNTPTTVPLSFVGTDINGDSSFTPIVRLVLSTAGTGSTLNASFDKLVIQTAVVPEPSTYAALIGLAGLAFAAYRRRR